MTENNFTAKPYFSVRLGAWLVLAWERVWPLLVPLFVVGVLLLAFSWLGGWGFLQAEGREVFLWLARAVFIIALIAALYPLRLFRLPNSPTISRHVEEASRLENRPLSTQDDEIAFGGSDRIAHILWREHQTRMSNKLDYLTVGTPKPEANRFDPFAIRAMVAIFAFSAFCYSFSPNGGSIFDMFQDNQASASELTRIDAWISPPKYTNKPPVYLKLTQADQAPDPISVPQGSEFFLRYIGKDVVTLNSAGSDAETEIMPEAREDGAADTQFRFQLDDDSVVTLKRGNEVAANWGLILIPDQAPKISYFEDPSSALSGSLQLSYTVEDDYGVVSARAIFQSLSAQKENARPLIKKPELPLPLPRLRAKKGVSKVNKDLTEHPWAGSKVKITLEARDDQGQVGLSEPVEFTLPGRQFAKPLSKALVEQRRILALDANERYRVADLLDAVSTGPMEYIDDPASVIGMRVAYRRLVDARTDDDLRSVLDLLWEIALGVEFGDLSEAERKLREAQEKLSQALEDGASSEEIDKLMQELREAMNEMMQALAEEARRSPQAQNPFQQDDSQMLTQNDLERMMDRIEDLAKSGSPDAARQMLSELQRMMDNLRAGRHQQQRQAEGNELNKSLDKLSELMQRQQELMEETFRMQRDQDQLQQRQNQNDQNSQQQQSGRQQPGSPRTDNQGSDQQDGQQHPNGQQGQMTEEQIADALERLQRQQEALERELGQLSDQLEQLGLGQPQELGEAQQQMGQANQNLSQGNPGDAASNQGRALEALRRGAQNMMQQMAGDRQQGGQQESQNGGQGQSGQRRGSDPLGRPSGSDGFDPSSNVEVPGEFDAQRARRILEAIRERLAIPDNPIIEKDYLERLLRSE